MFVTQGLIIVLYTKRHLGNIFIHISAFSHVKDFWLPTLFPLRPEYLGGSVKALHLPWHGLWRIKFLKLWLSQSNIIPFFWLKDTVWIQTSWKWTTAHNQNILEGYFFFAIGSVEPRSPHFYYLAENDNKVPPCLGVKSHIHLNWWLAGSCGMEMDLKPFTGSTWQAQWKRSSSSLVLAHIAWKSSVNPPPSPLPHIWKTGEKKGCLSSSVYI